MSEESKVENLPKLPEGKEPGIKMPEVLRPNIESISSKNQESSKERPPWSERVEGDFLLRRLSLAAARLDSLTLFLPTTGDIHKELGFQDLEVLWGNRAVLEEELNKPDGFVRTFKILNNIFNFADKNNRRNRPTHPQVEELKQGLLGFGISLVDRNIDKIEAVLSAKDSALGEGDLRDRMRADSDFEGKLCVLEATSYLEVFKKPARSAKAKKRSFDLLSKYVPRAIETFGAYSKKYNPGAPRRRGIHTILENIEKGATTEAKQEFVSEIMTKFFNECGDEELDIIIKNLMIDIFEERGTKRGAQKIKIAEPIFRLLHLDYTKLLFAWFDSGPRENAPSILARNTGAIFDLEKKKRGITSSLNDRFGIADFARYPRELLIKQYEEIEQVDSRPVGLVIYPRADWNEAFYHTDYMLRDLQNDLNDKGRIIVWEVGNQLELIHALNATRHKYGKISFAILGGHGSRQDVELSEAGGKGLVGIWDLRRKGTGALRNAFVENPTIILESCTTGELGGIGEEISKLGATVIAPPKSLSTKSIKPTFLQDGRIDWKVTYRDTTSREDVAPALYGISTH